MHAIITRGLYFFTSFFIWSEVYITDNLWTKNGNSSFFKPKIRGLYTRAVSNRERVIMARVRYITGLMALWLSMLSLAVFGLIPVAIKAEIHQYENGRTAIQTGDTKTIETLQIIILRLPIYCLPTHILDTSYLCHWMVKTPVQEKKYWKSKCRQLHQNTLYGKTKPRSL